MTITEALVSEHATFCVVFDHIDRALPHLRRLAEIRCLARLVEGLLLRHGAAEEDLVLVSLDRVLQQKARYNRFYQQHSEIDIRLRQAHESNRFVQARRLLQAALLASREHFQHEERVVFPLVERMVTRERLVKLGLIWMRQRTSRARRVAPRGTWRA